MPTEIPNVTPADGRRPMALRDLGLGVGLTLGSYFTVIVSPFMGMAVSVITPLPSLIGVYRWGRPAGISIPIVSSVLGGLLLLLMGLTGSIPYLVELVVLGSLLGRGMRQGHSLSKTVAEASVKAFALGILFFGLTHGGWGAGAFVDAQKRLTDLAEMIVRESGMSGTDAAIMGETIREMVPMVVRLFPGLALGSTVLVAWINLVVARRFCASHHIEFPDWGKWNLWKAPDVLVWVVIACGFAIVVSWDALSVVGMNGLMALAAVYLLQGLAIIAFAFERWNVPPFARGLVYAVLFLQQFVSLAVIVLGFFDTWFDFRHLAPKHPPRDGSSPEGGGSRGSENGVE